MAPMYPTPIPRAPAKGMLYCAPCRGWFTPGMKMTWRLRVRGVVDDVGPVTAGGGNRCPVCNCEGIEEP